MPEQEVISNLGIYALSIGVAIIIVAFIIILLTSIKDNSIVTDFSGPYGGGNGINQSLTWGGNNTAIGLTPRVIEGSVVLYNNGTKVNKGGNYTLGGSNIVILNASPSGKVGSQSEWVTVALNVSYMYNFGSSAYNSTQTGLDAQLDFSGFFPIIALTLAGAVIIGIVIRFFNRKRNA